MAYARRVLAAAPRWRRSVSSRSSASRHAGVGSGAGLVSSAGVGLFFIDTATGQIATQRQLIEAGMTSPDGVPPPPWHRIQGTNDASTMWYAVMRRREKGVFIGALVLRHADHPTLLRERGWEDVPVSEIGLGDADDPPPSAG